VRCAGWRRRRKKLEAGLDLAAVAAPCRVRDVAAAVASVAAAVASAVRGVAEPAAARSATRSAESVDDDASSG